jgi:hypothetical protein
MFQIQKKSEDQKKLETCSKFRIQNFSLFFRRSGHPGVDEEER